MTQLAAYISQLNPMEQKVLQIAASHLETSFSLAKSIGFQEWQAEQQKTQAEQQKTQAEQQQKQTQVAQIAAPIEQQKQAPAQIQEAPIQRKIKMKKLTPKNRSKLAPTLI